MSSRQKGRETPAGIFSVIEKEAEHYSNLYDDAYMPHMQRLTWSGIALHGGPLPGARCVARLRSHAIRLYFSQRLAPGPWLRQPQLQQRTRRRARPIRRDWLP